ncbi:SRPBCC family protein [Cellulomonas sp. ATA003]|uniref:SRPBCC family protein n=1 Tax=Cellulomonas sp. ATA003 TaxID=3073064 RepID=UPI0028731808|nr:SRPBCC family protein [Cellulomonas sp. ATA003]WNB86618.1 SRPBCC family protein [Cellulomonas sp. ATA003]
MGPSDDAGRVERHDTGVRLVFDRDWEVPVGEVWSALTDPDRLALWFGRWTGDPASGTVVLTLTGEGDAPPETVTIDACEPPHRLAVTTGAADARWPLEVTLTEVADGGTTLRFVHRLSDSDDVVSTGVGWHYYLDRLDAVVTGRPVTDDWDAYYPVLMTRYGGPTEGAVGSGAP